MEALAASVTTNTPKEKTKIDEVNRPVVNSNELLLHTLVSKK